MTWSGPLLTVVLVLLLLGVWVWARHLRRQSGLPAGDVIYTDSGTWYPNTESFYAMDLRLVGRPDYLVEQADGSLIPVELKSSRAADEPWEGHVLQLAAYCLLVEENFGVRPHYGILQYQDRAFAIDYTEELEGELLDLLAQIHEDSFEAELERDHNDWHRCAGCGVRDHCYQRLA